MLFGLQHCFGRDFRNQKLVRGNTTSRAMIGTAQGGSVRVIASEFLVQVVP